jgi:hypothetical protein
MISEDVVEAYNRRLTVDTSNIKNLTASQRDAVKNYGSLAEALIKNRDLAMFIHHYRFEVNDQLVGITQHTQEANSERIALANQLAGVDAFVNSLKRAVYKKNRLLEAESAQNNPST